MGSKSRQVSRTMRRILLSASAALFFTTPGFVSGVNAGDEVAINEDPPSSFPAAVVADWKAQDGTNYASAIEKIKNNLPATYKENITGSGEEGYLTACHWRRVGRMQPYAKYLKKMLYTRHHDIGGAIIGYTEDLKSDGARGLGPWGFSGGVSDNYIAGNSGGTAIHLLDFEDFYPQPTDLIADSKGCLRDPCPNFAGDTVVFAWSQDNNGYSLFNIDLATTTIKQLTFDLSEGGTTVNVSDMEPCVTPSGDIIFSSSRCFQHVDCNVNLVCNLYICDNEGKYLRRISFDQVNVFYPTMNADGTVMYTRWEYSDRNVHTVFGIFTMNQDGSRQNEFFGNQTSFPAILNQARQIPGIGNEMKALATTGAHNGGYNGDLCIVDAAKARNGSEYVWYIAPKRTVARNSGTPDADRKFQNPYPLDEEWFLISYRKTTGAKFQVFLMNTAGERELIATGGSQSVSQPVSLAPHEVPIKTVYQADYTENKAVVAVADVYYGTGTNTDLKNTTAVPRGSVKKIRVVALEYRTDPAHGNTGQMGLQMGPVGRYMCTWEAKSIVGEIDVADDGSAAFEVPPRTPLFLQLIAEDGTCIQTMRSWMTLQPGERFDCFGCHENKNAGLPDGTKPPKELTAKPLPAFYDLPSERGNFHFPDVIQPILDKHCVKSGCHDASHRLLDLTPAWLYTNTDLANDPAHKDAYRNWLRSYFNLSASKYVNCNAFLGPTEGIKPNTFGSSKSALITRLKGDHKGKVTFAEGEFEKICAWIDLAIPHSGTYTDDMKDEHRAMYEKRLERSKAEEAFEARNIEEFIAAGGYNQIKYRTGIRPENNGITRTLPLSTFKVYFLSTERMLSLHLPSEGKITLLDLLGRQLLSRDISKNAFLKSAQQKIRLNIPAGTYIVKFKGVKVTSEEVVSVLQ